MSIRHWAMCGAAAICVAAFGTPTFAQSAHGSSPYAHSAPAMQSGSAEAHGPAASSAPHATPHKPRTHHIVHHAHHVRHHMAATRKGDRAVADLNRGQLEHPGVVNPSGGQMMNAAGSGGFSNGGMNGSSDSMQGSENGSHMMDQGTMTRSGQEPGGQGREPGGMSNTSTGDHGATPGQMQPGNPGGDMYSHPSRAGSANPGSPSPKTTTSSQNTDSTPH